jgi:peptide-methionine (S)-S-oxide reductase
MPTDAPRALPQHPSQEHLKKQAKRLAKEASLPLSEAQHRLAVGYGVRNWAELMRRVDEMRGEAEPSRLAIAARAGDVAAVRTLLAEGHAVDDGGRGGTPLWHACASDAPDTARLTIAEALLVAGASPRRDDAGETPLHAAAARGPLALVELLIRKEALEWQSDRKGRTPLQAARRGAGRDRAAIIELLDRPVIRDASFRAAVDALHRGDVATLERLIDAEPRLLREHIREPECYREARRSQYFRDPKLFWFVANNPTLVRVMPANIGAIAQAMIARGVDKADLDNTLELVMSSEPARVQGHQATLIRVLIAAGATPGETAIDVALAHREVAAVETLIAAGHPVTLVIAAGTGRTARMRELLATATQDEIQTALGMAVINAHLDEARLALDAGADPNGGLPVHRHATPLHTLVLMEDLPLIALLLERGARLDIRDKLWNGTPMGWALHEGKHKAKAALEAFEKASADGTPDRS